MPTPTSPTSRTPAPLPTTGTHLAYLDVWRREVTYLEDPELLEKAIGVDTAARAQTVWQVKLLEAADGTSCTSQIPGWDALTAPSAGRLTTGAVGVPASTDPCTIPPTGGYRGTENRLYRVEIHDPGALGTATFKWSRDDASIASRVDTIDASRTELTVAPLGRDGVQRIRVDDWVEVSDDWLELADLPGELRQVTAVDDVRDAVTLSAPLTAGTFDPTDPGRHTRITRWDQSGPAVDAAGGVVAVPTGGTPLVLEDGVQITFGDDPAGGNLRTGDYWVFAARTADASVEQLSDAPPVGIHHHFCRLAVVTFPDGSSDCRQPPADGGDHDCACDVCVTPESHATGTMTIQHAVDIVRSAGGKVCLQVGLYKLERPVMIDGARSVELQGKGWKTIVITNGRAPAFIVERSLGVTIDRMAIVTATSAKGGTSAGGIAILLRNTIATIVERCLLLQLGLLQTTPPGGGDTPPGEPPPDCPPDQLRGAVASGEIRDLAAAFGPKGTGGPLIALDGTVIETVIQDNVLVGTVGIGLLGRALITYDLRIEHNVFVCWLAGVALEGLSIQLGDTRISVNSLLVCLRGAIFTTGITGPGGRIDAVGNIIRGLGYGIVAGTSDTRIEDNDVARLRGLGTSGREGSLVSLSSSFSFATATSERVLALFGGAAILLAPGIRDSAIDRCQIRGNRVEDMVGDGIAIRARIGSALIADNQLAELGGAGVAMSGAGAASQLAVERNALFGVGLLQNGGGQIAAGIRLSGSDELSVRDNTIDGVGVQSRAGVARWGIVVDASRSVRITGNTVTGIGPADEFAGLSAGIAVLDAFQRVDVLDNSVSRDDSGPSGAPLSRSYGILIGPASKELVSATGAFTVTSAGDTVVFLPNRGEVKRFPKGTASVAVRGNVVHAYGEVPAVLIEATTACLFNDNRCFLATRQGVPAVQLRAAAAVTANNFLAGDGQVPDLELFVPSGAPFTIVGNIAAGGLALNGTSPLPAPWKQLNV